MITVKDLHAALEKAIAEGHGDDYVELYQGLPHREQTGYLLTAYYDERYAGTFVLSDFDKHDLEQSFPVPMWQKRIKIYTPDPEAADASA